MENATLMNLNDMLFQQMQRISNPELKGDALKEEIMRAGSMNDVGKVIISNAELCLRAQVAQSEKMACIQKLPRMLDVGSGRVVK